jgi:DNA-directed RNA polymerase sigma subunit (sigma70/sigma32)
LLDLSDDDFNELVYYTSITREKRKAEIAQDKIDEVLGELTEHEKRVLQLLFGILDGRPRTLQEVGREFNLTAERVSEVAGKAMRKLRHPIRTRRLRDLLSSMDELDYPSQVFLIELFGSDWAKIQA